ncbi:MAG: sigma-70 family RNA polymerase sigma factor [Planctomycetota bacterium]|nr:sigma-70 family RNA polymerase sigma factor [Planctomycetota bacterium]
MAWSIQSEESFGRRLESARFGDGTALGRVLEDCRNYLLLTANQELDSDLQAKVAPSDVVQKTFLEACRDFDQFRGTSEREVLAWLRGILLNNLANVRRDYRDAAKRQVALERPWNSEVTQIPHDVPTPGTALVGLERRELVMNAIQQLPENYRQVLLLRQQEGLTFPEIGERLGRSSESARKIWARAVEQLKEILKSVTVRDGTR